MKSILVPTDFSDTATNAVHYAGSFCKENNLAMYLLHAMHVPPVDPDAPITLAETMMDNERKATHQKLEELKEVLKSEYDIHVETASDFGLGSDIITESAKENDAELIIMGTSGQSGFLASLLGSVTEAVVKHADIPVIAVPKNATFQKLNTVVFGNDYKESIADELAVLHKFIKKNRANLHMVSVQGGKEKYDQEIICEEGGVREVAVWASSAKEGLLAYLEKESVDLLAVKHHTRSFIEELFQKSTTKELLKDCSVPLFIF